MTVRYGSSLRAVPIEVTLERARVVAVQVGVSRVTDTVRLDRIGVPVFASIRPNAMQGSLCVSAGKGFTPNEAQVGAYMEAIELAYAEPQRAAIEIVRSTADEIIANHGSRETLEDLCPSSTPIAGDRAIDCVWAEEIRSGEKFLIPVERVVFPTTKSMALVREGSDGNGICSGNTLDEATLHGLAEVIERDITSFYLYDLRGRNVRIDTLPPTILELVKRLDALGIDLYVDYVPNRYELPCFVAVISERDDRANTHRGDGCHPDRAVALSRAVTEAVQSRLTVIHGGRDDLMHHRVRVAAWKEQEKADRFDLFIERLTDDKAPLDFSTIKDWTEATKDIPTALAFLVERLEMHGIRRIFRVPLAPPDCPFSILRIVVPELECFTGLISRIGRRLAAYHESKTEPPV